MWLNIAEIAKAAGCTLTLYMDDVNISGDTVPELVMWKIRQQVVSRGLKHHKDRHFRGGVAEVTGIVLRDGKTVLPNRQRKKVHQLRATLRQTDDPDMAAAIKRSLTGLLAQQKQVEPSRQAGGQDSPMR
jgi:retron-type reverse transcriptase